MIVVVTYRYNYWLQVLKTWFVAKRSRRFMGNWGYMIDVIVNYSNWIKFVKNELNLSKLDDLG